MLDVKIKRLTPTATLPTYGSKFAAGMDLYADCSEIMIPPHETVKVGSGFSFQPPKGYCGLILARSGLAAKQGLRPANCVGLCDEDYTGEYIVAIHNDSPYTQTILGGDRIAQLVFIPYEHVNLIEVEDLEVTERGAGGFGSTGK